MTAGQGGLSGEEFYPIPPRSSTPPHTKHRTPSEPVPARRDSGRSANEDRPVFANRQVRLRLEQRGEITPYGGLALAHDLAMRLELDKDLNRSLPLLKLHLPYHESDHLLTHVYNLFVGGGCIEDIANLQHSESIKHLLGSCP